MHILGLLFIILIIIFVFGIAIISAILRFIFGIGRVFGFGSKKNKNTWQSTSSQQTRQEHIEEEDPNAQSPTKQKKIFSKDDGEYVDFEEIK